MYIDTLLEDPNKILTPIFTIIVNEKFHNNPQIFDSLSSLLESSLEGFMDFLLQLYIQEKHNEFALNSPQDKINNRIMQKEITAYYSREPSSNNEQTDDTLESYIQAQVYYPPWYERKKIS